MPGTAGRVISNLVNRAKGLDEIHDDVAILDGIVDVPAKDSTADVQMSDVIGKKDDTAVGVVGTTKSLVAYLKGVLTDTIAIQTLHNVPTKDAATDAQMRDVVGKKDDTAVTTVATTKSLMAYLKGTLNQIADLITRTKGLDDIHDDLPKNASSETTGTYAHPNGVGEGTVKEITGTVRIDLKSIWIDLATLTQDATLKVYHKIDASTYRQYATYNWVTTDEDGVMIDGVAINNDWKVTITSAVAEGASRNIPYNIIYEPLE